MSTEAIKRATGNVFLLVSILIPSIACLKVCFINCSAYGIAAQALTAVIRAYDGRGPSTMLTSSIFQRHGLSSAEEIIGYIF